MKSNNKLVEEIDVELIKEVIRQIMVDDLDKEYGALEGLFQYLDKPTERLKSYLEETD